MPQDKASTDTNHDKVVGLSDAAWALLAKYQIDQIEFDAVAELAGVERGLAAALAGSVQRLILIKITELDRQSVLETYDDIQDAGEVSVREKIIEGLLHLFEVYAPYRSQINQLSQSVRSNPILALRLLDGLEAVIRRILVISGDSARGLKGMARVKGVAGVFLATGRVWMKDESNDLAATMKMLDQRMLQAEEWGISLRVFDLGRSRDWRDDSVSDDNGHDNLAAGR
jgi:ubiquinone biosynthesis protein COQ9